MIARFLRATPGGQWLVLALLFAALAVADYSLFGLTDIIDQRTGDIALRRLAASRAPSDRVVIVDIDQRSLELMNEQAGSWPWPRSVHGELADAIAAQGPRAIAFDVLFNELDVYRPEHDAAFADAVARNPQVWLAMTLNSEGEGARVGDMPAAIGAQALPGASLEARAPLMMPLVMLPHPEAMRGGLINFGSDNDRIGRHHNRYLEHADWRFASLPARIMQSLGKSLPQQQKVMLNWRRGWNHVSYADIYLDSLRQHPLRKPDEFKGKFVIVGTSAPGLMDLHLTPMGSTYPGVEVLATALDNLDRGDWLRETPRPTLLPLALALIALVSFGFTRGRSAGQIGAALLMVSLAVLVAAGIALSQGAFWPVYAPLAFAWACYLGATGLAYLRERAQRLKTTAMFARFLDPGVVAELIERGDIDHRASAAAREITVLFTDIRGFTALSEATRPEAVVELLNRYFSRQVAVIFRHGGTLDKFIGDAIMAFWGAPAADPEQAAHAVAAALEMAAALDELRGELGGELDGLGAELEIGIGIHTGHAVVGFIGSADRLDYTAIGDTVNLASRIEGLTKGQARILVSGATRAAADGQFDWQDCGSHRVKGREMPVQLFEPRPKTDKV